MMTDNAVHLLVVDDDEGVRTLVKEVLLDAGHRVLVAAGGPEALALVKEEDGQIDLLVTDVVMPGMNGVELHRQLLAQLPDLRVLFMTGYSDRHELDEIEGARELLISKPFSPIQLAMATQQALRSR